MMTTNAQRSKWFPWLNQAEAFLVYRLRGDSVRALGEASREPVVHSLDGRKAVSALRHVARDFELEPRHFESFERSLLDGEWCFSAWCREQLAFWGWVQFGSRRPTPRASLPIAPGHAFIYRCATHPQFRGRGIFPAALNFVVRELSRAGFKSVFVDHAASNHASRRGIERAGALPVGQYTIHQCGNCRCVKFDREVRIAVAGEVSHAC
jgi:ribosomal protein S18 acetylase RimI-like enzyme